MAERGESKKCVKILKKIAKTNGRDVKQEIYDSYEVWIDFNAKLASCIHISYFKT